MDRSIASPILDPTTWVQAHGHVLYRFALVRVRDPDVAEELVQETLLAALTARTSFRGQCSERSWLTAIVKRKVIDWVRSAVRQRARQEPLSDPTTDTIFTRSGKWRNGFHDWAPANPGLAMNRDDFQEILAGCLDKLPERLRNTFVLRHVDERSTDEVCREVGASAANVWVMLHRARLRLWRCLSINWFGDEPELPVEGRTP